MKLGLYNAIFHDRTLPEALAAIKAAGLTGIELNTGGFLPATHIPTIDLILLLTVEYMEFYFKSSFLIKIASIFKHRCSSFRLVEHQCSSIILHPFIDQILLSADRLMVRHFTSYFLSSLLLF